MPAARGEVSRVLPDDEQGRAGYQGQTGEHAGGESEAITGLATLDQAADQQRGGIARGIGAAGLA